jgi:hypothetical protein
VCAVGVKTELKHCLVRLKRIGDAEGKTVETQLRPEIPAIGDVIEVAVDGTSVPARVIEVGPLDGEGHCKIEADELSSSYVLDTFSALAQLDSGETQFDTRSSVPAKKPPLAFGATLSLARQCHGSNKARYAGCPAIHEDCAQGGLAGIPFHRGRRTQATHSGLQAHVRGRMEATLAIGPDESRVKCRRIALLAVQPPLEARQAGEPGHSLMTTLSREYRGAPGPIAGAGLPILAVGYGALACAPISAQVSHRFLKIPHTTPEEAATESPFAICDSTDC